MSNNYNKFSILFIGDVVGEPGMIMLEKSISFLKLKYNPDLLIVNGENTRNGKGLSEGLAKKYFQMGFNVITSGNHIWDYQNFHKTLNNPFYQNILRPLNYPEGTAGEGYYLFESQTGKKCAVINIQGRTFMPLTDCPFKAMDTILKKARREAELIFVDFHAEATAEKIAMAWHLDGKVSALVGTHTHVQTADERIFPEGLGYITDAGMTGSFDSVIGMKKEVAISRLRYATPFRYEGAREDLHLNGVIFNLDADSGQCKEVLRIKLNEKDFN